MWAFPCLTLPIDLTAWESDYKSGAQAKVDKLVRKFTARGDIITRGTSDEAQNNYVAAVTNPSNQARRRTNLAKVSVSVLHERMRTRGRGNYTTGVADNASKARQNFSPYASTIDTTVAGLPPRTQDAASNVTNRVLPLAVNLQNQKRGAT